MGIVIDLFSPRLPGGRGLMGVGGREQLHLAQGQLLLEAQTHCLVLLQGWLGYGFTTAGL